MRGSRRKFSLELLKLVLIAVTGRILSACGGGGASSGTTPASGGTCVANGTSVLVGGNHGHGVDTVTAAEVATGTLQTYNVTSNGTHTHTFTVSAANFTTLQGNTGIQVTSSTDSGHSHTLTINCV